jgi:pyruvate/2-oxoacid:ferredoxin oxidoreductase alpha subunit
MNKSEYEEKRMEYEAIIDMTDFLVGYGFTPSEAMKEAEDFWKKHKDKLKRIVAL